MLLNISINAIDFDIPIYYQMTKFALITYARHVESRQIMSSKVTSVVKLQIYRFSSVNLLVISTYIYKINMHHYRVIIKKALEIQSIKRAVTSEQEREREIERESGRVK